MIYTKDPWVWCTVDHENIKIANCLETPTWTALPPHFRGVIMFYPANEMPCSLQEGDMQISALSSLHLEPFSSGRDLVQV
jgi:hypothetical protein